VKYLWVYMSRSILVDDWDGLFKGDVGNVGRAYLDALDFDEGITVSTLSLEGQPAYLINLSLVERVLCPEPCVLDHPSSTNAPSQKFRLEKVITLHFDVEFNFCSLNCLKQIVVSS
jgi:hypothetical protein